jgi:hypothetical protein
MPTLHGLAVVTDGSPVEVLQRQRKARCGAEFYDSRGAKYCQKNRRKLWPFNVVFSLACHARVRARRLSVNKETFFLTFRKNTCYLSILVAQEEHTDFCEGENGV